MTRRRARCIAISDGHRCKRPAGKRSGDLFLCGAHSTMWLMLLIEDGCQTATRTMLAFARWETYAEGRRLIDRLYRRRAA
jgi:hypothetical protein